MASIFQPTGSGGTGLPYSNVSRIQLEQIRKADFYAGSKALTVGDSGNNSDTSPYNALGPGDINAEQFFTEQSTLLDDVYSLTPNPQPGTLIGTVSQVGAITSETVQWYGPTFRMSGSSIDAPSSGNQLADANANFVTAGVQPGDLVILKAGQGLGGIDPSAPNSYSVGAVLSVTGPTTLTMTGINNSFNGNGTAYVKDSLEVYPYVIVKPNAVLLFAYPGSGPTTGEEQTYLTVIPTSTLHSQAAPSTGQINADRVTNVVPPNYNLNNPNPLNPSVDAADSVYGVYAPRTTANLLGYRWIIYPDNGSGAPNLATPITPTSVIDPSPSLSGDQRLTFDYKAGIFRLSCAPKIGGAFKVAGGVDPSSGRMNLWAVFWAVDTALTAGSARSLYGLRSNWRESLQAGQVYYDTTNSVWRMGQTTNGNDFIAQAFDSAEDPTLATRFGSIDASVNDFRGFVYRPGADKVTFIQNSPWMTGDSSQSREVVVADKTNITVGDISAPPYLPGADFNATSSYNGSSTSARQAFSAISNALTAITTSVNLNKRVHLRAGRYYADRTIVIPPGVILEGEGPGATQVIQRKLAPGNALSTVFKIGPNTAWGVYDYGATNAGVNTEYLTAAPIMQFSSTSTLEGMDCVWNPVRHVWAYVWADVTANTVYIQEITPGGEVFPSSPAAIGPVGGRTLYTAQAANATYHTPNHYPRIAYHEHTDEYSIVYVDYNSSAGLPGPTVELVQIGMSNAGTASQAVSFPYGETPASIPTTLTTPSQGSTFPFSDHPSVAVDTSNPASTYTVWVHCWAYNTTNGVTITNGTPVRVGFSEQSVGSYVQAPPETFQRYVQSTDIKDDGEGGYMSVASVGYGIPFFSTTGSLTYTPASGAASGSGAITDTFPNGDNYQSYFGGTLPAAKFIYLGPTNTGSGFDGWAATPGSATTTMTVYPEDLTTAWVNASGNMRYVLMPIFTMETSRLLAGFSVESYQLSDDDAIIFGTNTLGLYQIDQTEPSYVRLSNGHGQWAVAYQAMKTSGFLSRATTSNFDNGLHSGFIDATITKGDLDVAREHISTCGIILNEIGEIAYPLPYLFTAQGETVYSRDLPVSLRSLGTRDPVSLRPNFYDPTNASGFGARNGHSFDRDISAANIYHRWNPKSIAGVSTAVAPSLFPSVAWTGQDWVIASPAQDKIHSKIGTYTVQSDGTTTSLTDASFYFGANDVTHPLNTPGSTIDGAYLKQTVTVGSDAIFFPGSGVHATITEVHSEHTVQLSSNILSKGASTSTTNTEWILIKNYSNLAPAGFKTPGFRLATDGRTTLSSTYLTMAEYAVPDGSGLEDNDFEENAINRVQTLRRPNTYSYTQSGLPFGKDGHQMPGTNAQDPVDTEARMIADLAYHGVCVGASKGCTVNYTEPPMVALAWCGDSYGVFQHNTGGISGTSPQYNFLEFYRQSFGPYQSAVKDMSIQTGGVAYGVPNSLAIISGKKVFTRHLAQGAQGTNGFFATDGYRNCFVSAESTQGWIYGATTAGAIHTSVNLALQAYYTDALGAFAIRKQGPTAQATLEFPPSYLCEVAERGAGTSTYDIAQYAPNQVGPKVVWDGQRFVAAWFEQVSWTGVGGSGFPAIGTLLNMTVFPGDEDQGLQTRELLDPADTLLSTNPTATAKISVGAQEPQTFQCDIAFSGRVYAVLWTGGLDAAQTTGGSMVGVTFFDASAFNGGTTSGGGVTYGIAPGPTRGCYGHPRILWDGKQFVAAWSLFETPGGVTSNSIGYMVIPEYGLSRAPQLKANYAQYMSGGTTPLGTMQGTAGLMTLNASTGSTLTQPIQPGDWLVITGVSTEDETYRGMFQVIDFDPSSGHLQFSSSNTGSLAADIYGYILSGFGLGDQYLLPTSGYTGTAVSSYRNAASAPLYSPFSSLSYGSPVFRLCGMAYNEVRDEYVVLFVGQSDWLYMGSFKLNATALNYPQATVITETNTRFGSLAWNGQNFLVTYVPLVAGNTVPGTTPETIQYALVSPTLQVLESGQLTQSVAAGNGVGGLVGNLPSLVPGPLYGPGSTTCYNASAYVQPRIRNLHSLWNSRLNRWVVSASLLWYDNTSEGISNTNQLTYAEARGSTQSTFSPSSWSVIPPNTIHVTSPSTWYVQPGTKTNFTYIDSPNFPQVTVATTAQVTSSEFTVDSILLSETNASAANYTGVMGAREDVFCWTLGSLSPAIKIQDADDVTIENVSFSGAGADIEERYPLMGRPTWQSGGPSAGAVATTTTYQYYRQEQYNHALKTPTMKVQLPRYINMRSTTKMRYGGTIASANRIVDRYLFDGSNRRG